MLKIVVKNTTSIGKKGESAVCEYLERNGHFIVERNYKTRFCEIDIVSLKDDKVFFTEVKYRKNVKHGGGFAAITHEKQKQMKYAVDVFFKFHPDYYEFNPLLAVASVSGDDFSVDDWFSV